MARSQEGFGKRENEKKKLQKRKEKEQRRQERQANSKDGKSLEDMMAYVDENGNLTNTPPDPTKLRTVRQEDIELGSRNTGSSRELSAHRGKVSFFNESKGYGFIKDEQTQESVFVHVKALTEPIGENDIVTFETRMEAKGPVAVNVKRVVPE